MMIHATVVHASYVHGVKKLLYLGSSCIYPRDAHQPMTEEALLTGPLEPTNEPYAIAKIAGIKLCQAYRAQYGANFISAMPTNLYGPNDNFDLTSSHVLPALMRKFHDAKIDGARERRDLGHRHAAPRVPARRRSRRRVPVPDGQLRRATATSTSAPARISASASSRRLVRDVVYPEAELAFDTTKPDGTPRKLLDVGSHQRGSDGRRRSSSARASSRPTRGSSNTSGSSRAPPDAERRQHASLGHRSRARGLILRRGVGHGSIRTAAGRLLSYRHRAEGRARTRPAPRAPPRREPRDGAPRRSHPSPRRVRRLAAPEHHPRADRLPRPRARQRARDDRGNRVPSRRRGSPEHPPVRLVGRVSAARRRGDARCRAGGRGERHRPARGDGRVARDLAGRVRNRPRGASSSRLRCSSRCRSDSVWRKGCSGCTSSGSRGRSA